MARDAFADPRDERLVRLALILGELPPEGDRDQHLGVGIQDEHSAVVVVDQAAQLGRDGLTDHTDVVQAVQLRREGLEHPELGHGPGFSLRRQGGQSPLRAGRRGSVGPLDLFRCGLRGLDRPAALIGSVHEDSVLARGLGREQGEVGAGDELPGARGVHRPLGHTHAGPDPPHSREVHFPDPRPDPLAERHRVFQRGSGKDHRELLAPDAADDVLLAAGLPRHRSDALEDLVTDQVAVRVVDPLEVVDVVDQQPDRGAIAVGPAHLLPKPLVEVAVVVEGREVIGDHLGLEPGADLGVVDRKGGEIAEGDRQLELAKREVVLLPQAVHRHHAFELPSGQQGHGDHRLGFGLWRARDVHRPGILVHVVDELRGARLGRDAGDAPPVGMGAHGEDLLRVQRVPDQDRADDPKGRFGPVQHQAVVGDQLRQGVSHGFQDLVGGPLGHQEVGDVGEHGVGKRRDELGLGRLGALAIGTVPPGKLDRCGGLHPPPTGPRAGRRRPSRACARPKAPRQSLSASAEAAGD